MNFVIDGYASAGSILLIALAVLGLPLTLFWAAVAHGLSVRQMQDGIFKRNRPFMFGSYRCLFKLHRSPILRAASFALGAWSIGIIVDAVFSVRSYGYIFYSARDWVALIAYFFVAYFLFASLQGQGLALKLDEYLLMSWDAESVISLHLRKEKIEHLSYSVIASLIVGAQQLRGELKKLDIEANLHLQSWLLAPRVNRHDIEIKKLHRLLRVPFCEKRSHRTIWKCFMRVNAFACLLFRSRKIGRQLKMISKPQSIVVNGLHVNKYTKDIIAALADLKPGWSLTPIPLSRVSTVRVIGLLVYNPRVYVEIGGWEGGVLLID